MDNVTHTLAGLLLGDAALQLRSRSPHRARPKRAPASTVLLVSALANNAPDLDLLYLGITGGKLGYLLHHRGHTHTLVAAVVLVPVCLALAALVERARFALKRDQSRTSHVWAHATELSAIAAAGVGLHQLMDFGNNYGVHPWWPLSNHWYYGDAVFIVEPWLLALLSGALFGAARGRIGKLTSVSVAGGVMGLAAWTGLVDLRALAALATLTSVWFYASRKLAAQHRPPVAGVLIGAWLVVQLLARSSAQSEVERAIREPNVQTTDWSKVPMPGNPLCWEFLVVQSAGSDHLVRRVMASAWPSLLPAAECTAIGEASTAPLTPTRLPLPPSGGVLWRGEFRAPLSELQGALPGACQARAAARFLRVPFWLERRGVLEVLGDLRFDRSPGLEFTEIEIDANTECPRFVPNWQPPLESLRLP